MKREGIMLDVFKRHMKHFWVNLKEIFVIECKVLVVLLILLGIYLILPWGWQVEIKSNSIAAHNYLKSPQFQDIIGNVESGMRVGFMCLFALMSGLFCWVMLMFVFLAVEFLIRSLLKASTETHIFIRVSRAVVSALVAIYIVRSHLVLSLLSKAANFIVRG